MIVRSRAPLRLSFAGGGTELSPYLEAYGGQILNGTIGLHAYATLEPNADGRVKFVAADQDIALELPAESPVSGDDLPLHRGVYNRIVGTFNGGRPLPVTVTTFCDAPVGSGLGSSSTLTVAMIKAFDEYLGLALDEYSLARIAYEVERQDLNLEGGRQDQYAAAFGGFNFIEFHEDDRVVVNPLRIPQSTICEFEASLILYYTGKSRHSAQIIEEQTKLIREQNEAVIRHLHTIKSYCGLMKEYLLKGNIEAFAEVLDRSWAEKRATASSISNATIDHVYEVVRQAGVIGGKISGAGGGGFMMLICRPERRMHVLARLAELGGTVIGCSFVSGGAHSWRIRTSELAREKELAERANARPLMRATALG
jgi:D-glycero-alpha-D-manno-heptose-7-phosphate kinase